MEEIKIKNITSCLEEFAPLSYREDYDNVGLLTGDANDIVSGVIVAVDCTEKVIDEAIERQCNMIISHHPILFKGIKKLTGENYVERSLIKAIKNDIAIYAIHTNIDNVYNGVSGKIAERLKLKEKSILVPKSDTLSKLVSFAPKKNIHEIMKALYQAGVGNIGKYKNCSFQTIGTGTFLPTEGALPHKGTIHQNEQVEEVRLEVIFPSHAHKKIVSVLRKAHPYEEVAYYITALKNENQEVGLGIVGKLEKPLTPEAFLDYLKNHMNTVCIRYTQGIKKTIQKVAVCGGAGSSFLPYAIAHGADVYVSGDFKYHDFFEANGEIMIADIGHYESEQFTKSLIKDILEEKFPNFEVILSKTVTNPIHYHT